MAVDASVSYRSPRRRAINTFFETVTFVFSVVLPICAACAVLYAVSHPNDTKKD